MAGTLGSFSDLYLIRVMLVLNVHTWADQLLAQLLIEQKYRHIGHLNEEV